MNISHEKFLSKFLKKLNTIDTVKELCAETVQGVLKFTKAQAGWIYLPNQELNSVSVKKIYYTPDINKKTDVKKSVETIFTLGEDLFSNNYEMEDTLDYFKNLSKERTIIIPIIVRGFLLGYFALIGRRIEFNYNFGEMLQIITDFLSARLEIMLLRVDLENHDKQKIQFLASISHEYKTPLNSIIGFSDILKDRLDDTDEFKYIDNISKSAKFLLSLIQDILDMSRAEISKLELHKETFRTKEIIEDISYSFDEIVKSKNLHFSYTVVDVEIYADLRRFKQLIYNLISNAVKFNKLNGKITIVSYLDENNDFVFEIKDTGDGIRKKDYDTIFSFFSQVNRSVLKRQQGSGIGLALCKKIVEAHGGEIGFKSRLNSGSTFWFTIPQPEQLNISAE